MNGILELPADDCVKTLAGDGKAFLEARQRTAKLEKLATEANIQTIDNARAVLATQWPVLQDRQPAEEIAKALEALAGLLESDSALERVETVRLDAAVISTAYRTIYTSTFEQRRKAYTEARDEVKGHPDWLEMAERFAEQPDQLASLLAPLSQRADPEMDLPAGATTCRRTGATLGQIESDLEAVESITRQVLRKVIDLAAPEEKVERVAVAKLYPGRLANDEDLDSFIESLRERLAKAIAQGSTIVFD